MQTALKTGLSGNQLKLLALVLMTVDHIGMILLPYHLILRIIGRLAMPVFAYMIAEGCRYTRSGRNYLVQMVSLGVVCALINYFATGYQHLPIFITFSLSAGLIFSLERLLRQKNILNALLLVGVAGLVLLLCEVLPGKLSGLSFDVDYGFWGVLLPVLFYLGRNKTEKLILGTFGLAMLAMDENWVQWFALLAIPLLALYNGTRGKWKIKYLFYLYYPLHIALLYGIGYLRFLL